MTKTPIDVDEDLPEEQPEEEITAAFHKVVHDASAQAQTGEQRDEVLNALYDVFVRVGDDDGDDLNLPTVAWVPA